MVCLRNISADVLREGDIDDDDDADDDAAAADDDDDNTIKLNCAVKKSNIIS